jgi:excisionase family DNA binding protein
MITLDLAGDVRAAVASMVPELRAAIVEAVRTAMADRLLTVDEAAEVARCSPGAIRKRIARGSLRAVRNGHTVRVRASALLGEGGERRR